MTEQDVAPITDPQLNANDQTIPGQGNPITGAENGSEGHRPPREQRYRLERNAARGQVEALQTREVERLAGEHLAQPGDLLQLGGVTLSDLLAEGGFVDSAAVADAVASLIIQRPGLARHPRVAATDPTQGHAGGGGKREPAWGDLLKRD